MNFIFIALVLLVMIGAVGISIHAFYVITKYWPGDPKLVTHEWLISIVGDRYVRFVKSFIILGSILTLAFSILGI